MFDNLAHGLRVLAERRRLDDLLPEAHMRQTEAAPDQEAVAERVLHLVRLGARADVEILRRASQQKIPHATAHEVGGVAELVKTVQDPQRIRIDIFARNAMIRTRPYHRHALLGFLSA